MVLPYIIIFLLIVYILRIIFIKKMSDFLVFDSKHVNKELIILTAYVLKADGEIKPKEIDFIKWYFKENYNKKELNRALKLLTFYFNKQIKIERSLKYFSYKETFKNRANILNFLIKITTIDGFLTDSEYKALQKICLGLELGLNVLTSLLATHSFITEKEFKERDNYKKTKPTTSNSKLLLAYKTLGLDTSCTEKEIKKAYRKLVVLYHPDKLTDTNDKLLKQAKANFIKVNEAYEYLKDRLRFK